MFYHIDAMRNGVNGLEIVFVDIVLDNINGVDDDGVAFRRLTGVLIII
jgi:hypothetical protein